MIAQDFLVVANQLMNSNEPQSEAMLRTVVGRAYYTVYLLTRDWVDERFPEDIKNTTGNSHEKYSECLKKLQRQYMDLSFSKFARQLAELKDKRKFADYNIKTTETQDLISAQESLLQAQGMIKDLESLIAKYP